MILMILNYMKIVKGMGSGIQCLETPKLMGFIDSDYRNNENGGQVMHAIKERDILNIKEE